MYYLGRGVDPDCRVEQYVVTQLLQQQNAILQVAKVPGKGQYDVQDRPCHMYVGRLENKVQDRTVTRSEKIPLMWTAER